MTSSSRSPSSDHGSATPGEPVLYDVPRPGEDFSPWAMLKTLWRGKWLILGIAFLAGSLSYVYWQQQPKKYRTSSVLLLEESEQFERFDLALPVNRSNSTGRDLYFLRNSEVFARTVARRLADRVASTPVEEGSFLHAADGDRPPPSALASNVRSAVTVKRGSRSVPAIKITVTSAHPTEAALVTNTYAQAYLDHLRRSSNARLRTSRQFLERQRQELKQRLRSIEDTIAAQVRKQGRAGLLAPGDSSGGTGFVGEARQIASEIADLRVKKEKIQIELDVEQTMLDTTQARLNRIRPNLAERASSNTGDRLQQTRKQIASLQNQIQQIQVRNETLDGDLQAQLDRMKARAEQLRNKSRRLADQYVQEALAADAVNPMGEGGSGLSTVVDLRRQITEHRIGITKLKARRAALVDRIEARKAALRESPDRTLARLKRRKQTTEELFVALSKSLQKIRVSAESTPQQAQILQRAKRPTTPIGPNVKNNVVLALLFGGALGAGLVIVYAKTDDRIEEPEDVEELSVGLFGVVPSWEGDDEGQEDSDGEEAEASGRSARPWSMIAAPCSPAAEAYRHVATNLRLGLPTAIDILLVTSPGPRDGKSTTTANLGVALSEAGQDVLLVDADPYGATLHRQFGGERAPGLTDELADGTGDVQMILPPTDESIAVSGDGAPSAGPRRGRLGLLPTGTDVPQPSLLLQEEHVRSVLQTLKSDWDLLLLDTPPILAYDAASRLAALSDVALLIASAGDTSREAYTESAERLNALCEGPVAGVLNRYSAANENVYGYGYSTYTSASHDAPPVERMVQRTKRGFRRLATGR